MVVDYLNSNSNLYKELPVVSQDPYNADTDPPTAQDAYIDAIANHELQQWAKYVQVLRVCAWGDHIAIQGTCDMFNVTVHVLSSQSHHGSFLHRSYIIRDSEGDVYVGLILQYKLLLSHPKPEASTSLQTSPLELFSNKIDSVLSPIFRGN